MVGEGGETLENVIKDEPHFIASYGGNGSKGGSITLRMGGCWFAKRSMKSNEGVEKISSTGSILIDNGDDCFDSYVGSRGEEVNEGGVDLGVYEHVALNATQLECGSYAIDLFGMFNRSSGITIVAIKPLKNQSTCLRNYDPIDDEPMWAANRVVALTLGSVITIPETANEFAIKDSQYKELQSRAKQPTSDLDDDDLPMSREEEAKFMQTFRKTRFYNDYRDQDSNRDN
ncbi:hypothetical protein Tco_1409485 [Tanacetum coccineum]